MKKIVTDEDGIKYEIEFVGNLPSSAIVREIPKVSKFEEFIKATIPPRVEDCTENHWYRLGYSIGAWAGYKQAIQVLKDQNYGTAPVALENYADIK